MVENGSLTAGSHVRTRGRVMHGCNSAEGQTLHRLVLLVRLGKIEMRLVRFAAESQNYLTCRQELLQYSFQRLLKEFRYQLKRSLEHEVFRFSKKRARKGRPVALRKMLQGILY